MALGIMIAGLVAAVLGTTLSILLGLDLSFALVVYGLFGVGGGILACFAGAPVLRNLGPQRHSRSRTSG
jgi:hypothetical protein